MSEAASLRGDGGGARVASGRVIATVQSSEASLAWARAGAAGEGGAAGNGVATVQSSEASLAWARTGSTGGRGWRGRERHRHRTEQRGLVGVGASRKHRRERVARPGTASPPYRAARPRWRGREGRTTTTTTEVTATTTGAGMLHERARRARVGREDRRQLRRGDDNYPRVVAETGAEGREEGRGWDRQK